MIIRYLYLADVSCSSIRMGLNDTNGPLMAVDGLRHTFFSTRNGDNEIYHGGTTDGLSFWRIDLKRNYFVLGVYILDDTTSK